MIKRGMVAALAIALLTNSLAQAATKTGTKCSKLGQTTTSGGLQYTCVKSGGKLVWSVGKRVTSAVPVPPATPSPTPTPTATPGKQTPLSAQSNNAVIVQKLLDEAWAKSASMKIPPYSIKIQPGYEKAPIVLETITQIDPALKLLAAIGAPVETNFTMYFVKDWSWFQQFVPTNNRCYKSNWVGASYCGGGIDVFNIDHFAYVVPTGLEDLKVPIPVFQGIIHALPHEIGHQSQGDYLAHYNRTNNLGPTWLLEGGAEVIGTSVYAQTHGMTYLEARDQYLQYSSLLCKNVKITDLLMNDNHPDDCQGVNGLISTEVLIGTTGRLISMWEFFASKIAEYGPDFGKERNGMSYYTWKYIMNEMYGIDVATWEPIVNAEIQKWAPVTRNWTN